MTTETKTNARARKVKIAGTLLIVGGLMGMIAAYAVEASDTTGTVFALAFVLGFPVFVVGRFME